jgi:hypothetical protein
MFPNWWMRSRRRGQKHQPDRRVRPRSLAVERLEDRIVLDAVHWNSAAGGDWDNPANWDLGRVPLPTDDAFIQTPGITVTHNAGSDSVQSITSDVSTGTFDVHGGTPYT